MAEAGVRKLFLVCDGSIRHMDALNGQLEELGARGVETVFFRDFEPNPLYESVVRGVETFREKGCDGIMAIGGGSAMDVAKCVKLYSNLPGDGAGGSWLSMKAAPSDVPFMAAPTTAGTGSEATRYAVIYYRGAKQSIADERVVPDAVLMDPSALRSLPLYQRKATMCDALCHAVESFWSVNSTEESMEYSGLAVRGVLEYMDGYLRNSDEGNAGMLRAAHIAGKAINIAQTTAGHAMCYKITSLFGCAHGHAAILCDRVLFPWMIENTDRCVDPRGGEHLEKALDGIGGAMGCEDARSGADRLAGVFGRLGLAVPAATERQYEELAASVNPVRLRNHPVRLGAETIDALYHEILR